MANFDDEAALNQYIDRNHPGRNFILNPTAHWGELILPAPDERAGKVETGLRLVVFASFPFGYLTFQTLKAYEQRYPRRLNIVALATDDPMNPSAKISVKKRIWQYVDDVHRARIETACVESALSFGVPVYTGQVKDDSFRKKLRGVRPDAIVVCGFGQLIDHFIIERSRLGIYNLHPSDLVGGHGAGPAPYDELAERGATIAKWTVHQMSEVIDGGPVVGQSPAINVSDIEGNLPGDPLLVYDKMTEAVPYLAFHLIEALIARNATEQTVPLEQLDFPTLMSEQEKRALMAPIINTEGFDQLPEIPPGLIADD